MPSATLAVVVDPPVVGVDDEDPPPPVPPPLPPLAAVREAEAVLLKRGATLRNILSSAGVVVMWLVVVGCLRDVVKRTRACNLSNALTMKMKKREVYSKQVKNDKSLKNIHFRGFKKYV